MVQLTFEQIIPGPQRLVAKCPIDHPFYIRHKGWSTSNPTEAMARYGIPFRTLHCNDICIQAPKGNQTTPIITSATGAAGLVYVHFYDNTYLVNFMD